jgi:hypothetical protein
MTAIVVPLGAFVFVAFLIYVIWWIVVDRDGGGRRRRLPATDGRKRYFADAFDAIAGLNRQIGAVPFWLSMILVLGAVMLLFARGFHVATTAEVAEKDGSTVFFHTCRYLSFSGLHDVDSVFHSSTYQEAASAPCPFFEK